MCCDDNNNGEAVGERTATGAISVLFKAALLGPYSAPAVLHCSSACHRLRCGSRRTNQHRHTYSLQVLRPRASGGRGHPPHSQRVGAVQAQRDSTRRPEGPCPTIPEPPWTQVRGDHVQKGGCKQALACR